MSVESIIKLENVVKVFDNLEVIHNCNMNVPKGAIYGFVSANGARKTTILKLIMGLLNPISGEITVMGNHIPAERQKVLKKIGSIIETPIFYDHLSAEENLRLYLEYMQVYGTLQYHHDAELLRTRVYKNFSPYLKCRESPKIRAIPTYKNF